MTAEVNLTLPKPPAPLERTEHPHVVKSADTLGGEPRVDGTRIPVRQILNLVEAGTPYNAILDSYPPLTLAQIHDALSYAYDHPNDMSYYEERQKIRNVMRDQDLVLVNHRLIPRARLAPADVAPGEPVYTWETLPERMEE